MNDTNQQTPQQRREARWQFRRGLMLAAARILENDPQAWERMAEQLRQRETNEDKIIRRLAKKWEKRAESPEKLIRFLRENFEVDTPVGRRREFLKVATEGHPFCAVIPQDTRDAILASTLFKPFPGGKQTNDADTKNVEE